MSGCLEQKVLRYEILWTDTLAFQLEKSFIKREWVCVEGWGVSSTRQLGREERWDPRAESPPCSRKTSLPVSLQGPGRRGDSEEKGLWQCHVTDG